jgi:hypothetical protein
VSDTAVFVGPSLDPATVRRCLPEVRVEPPAARGDVARLRAQGVGRFLLIDGAFGHRLAVSPRELVGALDAGCRVIGAASLGAIRAAECRPAGMEGIGAIQLLYRWRVISCDDEVAVAVEPDRQHRACSVALINVRFAVLAALRRAWISRPEADAVLAAAKRRYFAERTWRAIFAGAGVEPDERLRRLCEETDVKRRDAELAVARLAGERWRSAAVPRGAAEAQSARRYHGHDPLFGHTREQLEPVLWRWLRDSGRLTDPRTTPGATWDALAAENELEHELIRWYAAHRLGNPQGPNYTACEGVCT